MDLELRRGMFFSGNGRGYVGVMLSSEEAVWIHSLGTSREQVEQGPVPESAVFCVARFLTQSQIMALRGKMRSLK